MVIVDSLRVGFFLALRSLWRGSRSVSVLTIVILTLIFLNLVAISGLLLGLVRGSEIGFIDSYSGTILIESLETEKYIQDVTKLIDFTENLPGYISHARRLSTSGTIEIGYKEKVKGSDVSNVGAVIYGVDPEAEVRTTTLDDEIIDGRFLKEGDRDVIVLGSILAGRGGTLSVGESLEGAYIGEKVRVVFANGAQREYTIIGITKAKNNILNTNAYMTLDEVRDVINIEDDRLSQIAVLTEDAPFVAESVKQQYVEAGYAEDNSIQTWTEALGSLITDINDSFSLIGDIVGTIALLVGGVTIFIVTFVNAMSKRRFIGILKASGISSSSIILSYIFQAFFYTVVSIVLGLFITYSFLIPYVDENPIDFPFADGILYVTTDYVAVRIIILLAVAVLSGYLPARMITKQNTLNAILGR